ncbi:MAG TPA: NADH-quinone oxidoreductase subunit C [Egibacteraceae bacterium]|nr:NADH-quinone oxidoreductase subunit C [Egibacteraceae bacterium]
MTETSAVGTGVNTPATRPAGHLDAEAMLAYLSDRLEARLLDSIVAYEQLTVVVDPEAWADAIRLCKEDPGLDCAFWEFLDAVDRGEEGFDAVCHVYSVRHRHGVTLQTRVPGGRENPTLASVSGIYRGANWAERETYDMFGITFEGHPGLEPRILTVPNFEGWPLRKDFQLTSRNAKPWPGAKEPEERKDSGAGGGAEAAAQGAPAEPEDKAAAAKAKAERAKAKAAAMRAKKAAERAAAEGTGAPADQAEASDAQRATEAETQAAAGAAPGGDLIADAAEQYGGGDTEDEAAAAAATAAGDPTGATPEGAAEVAGSAIAKDAAAGAAQGDMAARATQDSPDTDEPVVDAEAEAAAAQGARPVPSGTPGPEAEGRHGGAEVQSGATPAAQTPGMTSDTQDSEPARGVEEPPAPGPESDRPVTPEAGASSTPHGGAPQGDDVPLVPAPGAESAPLPTDPPTDAADDDVAGVDRRAEDVGPDPRDPQAEVMQERVEEGPAPEGPSERADAADRADPDRSLGSDDAKE